ncbi:MAG: DUF2179 domain-containing protein [Sedimentisphaerales bacterium]|nr:DUF2179 domain-containing protein [Sedimentisphaerales bacterium]
MLGFSLYTWVLLPGLIFIARVLDVTLGTVRVIFVSKGMKYLAPVVGFFEILIWLLAIGQIMSNLTSPACYIAYAGGFATGNYVGIIIAEKLSLGVVLLRVVTQKEAVELISSLSLAEYGVTSVDGEGINGAVKIIFTVVPRKEVSKVIEIVKKFNPKSFYTIEDIGFVEKGIFPLKKSWHNEAFEFLFRPFRKGK